jgi:hypothetical protein
LIIQKTMQGAKAAALCCYIGGILFIATGIAAAVFMPRATFLIFFSPALGIGLVISGVAYSRVAKRQIIEPSA